MFDMPTGTPVVVARDSVRDSHSTPIKALMSSLESSTKRLTLLVVSVWFTGHTYVLPRYFGTERTKAYGIP